MEDDFTLALQRYLEIQEEEKRIKEEKSLLKDVLEKRLTQEGRSLFYTQINNKNVRIAKTEKVNISYNEDILKERLQDKYASILSLDIDKVKKNREKIEQLLGSNGNEFSSPDRNKIRELIEKGLLRQSDFQGAFKKEIKTVISVSKRSQSFSQESPF